ncbi:unnamed protein product [Nezara viridula]|uniref:Uncharacterized protein n=1 Tax=Nezara viridula TaxID=85310 RepID=A0A9P0H2V2_NEZVI|nr:unnamed protein product [Nezara viridula]CAH1390632.1 unnamed protein product [Nezara viridula]
MYYLVYCNILNILLPVCIHSIC